MDKATRSIFEKIWTLSTGHPHNQSFKEIQHLAMPHARIFFSAVAMSSPKGVRYYGYKPPDRWNSDMCP
jgi:hypothetical protein